MECEDHQYHIGRTDACTSVAARRACRAARIWAAARCRPVVHSLVVAATAPLSTSRFNNQQHSVSGGAASRVRLWRRATDSDSGDGSSDGSGGGETTTPTHSHTLSEFTLTGRSVLGPIHTADDRAHGTARGKGARARRVPGGGCISD